MFHAQTVEKSSSACCTQASGSVVSLIEYFALRHNFLNEEVTMSEGLLNLRRCAHQNIHRKRARDQQACDLP